MWKNVFNETKVENQNSHHHKNTIPKVKHGGGIIILGCKWGIGQDGGKNDHFQIPVNLSNPSSF